MSDTYVSQHPLQVHSRQSEVLQVESKGCTVPSLSTQPDRSSLNASEGTKQGTMEKMKLSAQEQSQG
uniref:Uncharacterized protein n=2 Tax=Anguilla anguilla TaxID=7936 RepID=A0A0E9Y063_ANGAN